MNPLALQGKTVALPETRELDVLARMLEDHGATILRCPLVAILDAPDPAPVEAWLRELIDRGFDDLILFTGEGLRRLLGFATRAGWREEFIAAVGKTRTIVRGPKPAKALREIGLQPSLSAAAPTSEGILQSLKELAPAGRRCAIQLFSADAGGSIVEYLQSLGCTVATVVPYIYAPRSDSQRVLELLDALTSGGVDVLAFTSASQVDRLWEVAREHQRESDLLAGLQRCRLAAVGPIVADALREHGARVDITPEKSFFMGTLVKEIVASVQ